MMAGYYQNNSNQEGDYMGVRADARLKELQTRRDKASEALKSLKQEHSSLSSEISKKEKLLNSINQEIAELSTNQIIISEHAILRYLERVLGVDIELVKKEILTSDLEKKIEVLGNGTYPIQDGLFKAKVRNGTIITILEAPKK